MAGIHSEFRGGEIQILPDKSFLPELGGLEDGSPLRGVLLLVAVFLLIRNYWLPAGILFAVAALWSILAMALKNWRRVRGRCRAQILLGRGEDSEEAGEHLRPGGRLWRRRLGLLFQQNRWEEVGGELAILPDGEGKDYLLALAFLGQGRAREALSLCPSRTSEKWLTLKAEALFRLEEWNKLLRMLRSGGGKDKLERTWLKAMGYYRLKQYKPAARLLALVVRQGGPEYGEAALLLDRALARR